MKSNLPDHKVLEALKQAQGNKTKAADILTGWGYVTTRHSVKRAAARLGATTKLNFIDPRYKEWATDHECTLIDLLNKYPSLEGLADNLNTTVEDLSNQIAAIKVKGAIKGYAPDYDLNHAVPEGFVSKGATTQYDSEGNVVQQWVKSKADDEARYRIMSEVIAEQCKKVKKVEPTSRKTQKVRSDLLNVYTMTDCHVGMLAWEEETGENWDLEIAEETLTKCFAEMVDRSPMAKKCVIANLGDWLHYDGLVPVTPTSKHILDTDTRFGLLVKVAVHILRNLVKYALDKHDKVYLLIAEGNHDMASSVWMRTLFQALYENEPRVEIIQGESPYYVHQFGQNMLFWHHGHLKKPDSVPLLAASEYPEIWGNTKHRFAHLGDKHHKYEKEHSGMTVIQHPTLAARDAYAARGGWKSAQQATAITYHKEFGEHARFTVSPEIMK